MPGFQDRILRAAKLDVHLYEEVEADRGAMGQAMAVVAMSSVAAGIGTIGMAGVNPGTILWGIVGALGSWYIWAYLAYFIGDFPLVAHNASFDRRFLDTELEYINRFRKNRMACSMLAARRLFPKAPNHKLSTLVRYCGIYHDGTFHRALADAEMTGRLWITMVDAIKDTFGLRRVDFDLMRKLCRKAKAKVPAYLTGIAGVQRLNNE